MQSLTRPETPLDDKIVSRELTNRTYPSRDKTIDLYALGGSRKESLLLLVTLKSQHRKGSLSN